MAEAISPDEVARWRRAEALVDALLDLPAAEREAALLRATAGEPVLQADAQRWLAAAGDPAGLTHHCPLPPDAFATPPPLAVGSGIGPWRVLGVAGTGGMGVVYEAERADGAFTRRVALKVINGPAGHALLTERFLAERRILAGLEHPNIARLLDGGVTPDGAPYYAMEFVAGEPLDRWCDDHRVELAGRLRLLRQVCAAVAYAHRRLVIHRDLKPSNILVTAAGEVKLLDFGIAGWQDPPPEEAPVPGARLLTPAYASPEEMQGADPSVSGDVYSLGVVLHELVTGRRPAAGGGAIALEPHPPGMPGGIPGPLRADVVAILSTALDRDRARRYPSVEALDADLERCLAGLPVRAHPDRWSYRAAKFGRRHWLALGAGILATLALLAVTTVALVQAARARREARRNVEAVVFLGNLLALPYAYDSAATTPSLRAMLDAAVLRLDSLAAAGEELDPQLYESLGLGYAGLGANGVAADLVARALALRRARGDADSILFETSMQLAGAQMLGGQESEALVNLRRLAGEAPRRFGPQAVRTAQVLVTLQTSARRLGRLAEAESAAVAALAILKQDTLQGRIALAHAHHNLGHIRMQQGRLEEARREYQAARTIRVAAGASPVEVANSHANLALVAAELGLATEADSLLGQSEALKRHTLDAMHPEITDDLRIRGELRLRRGDATGAEREFREALARYRQRGRAVQWQVVPALVGLGEALIAQGREPEAEPPFAAARDSLQRLGDAPTVLGARIAAGLAAVARGKGERQAADSLVRACRTAYLRLGGSDDPRVGGCVPGGSAVRRFGGSAVRRFGRPKLAPRTGAGARSARQ